MPFQQTAVFLSSHNLCEFVITFCAALICVPSLLDHPVLERKIGLILFSPYPPHLTQCLPHSRSSVNTWWMEEFVLGIRSWVFFWVSEAEMLSKNPKESPRTSFMRGQVQMSKMKENNKWVFETGLQLFAHRWAFASVDLICQQIFVLLE